MNDSRPYKQPRPICAGCGRQRESKTSICARCSRHLDNLDPLLGCGPAGLDRVWSSAPYESTARSLVAALKFRHLLPVADLMADRIDWLAPAHMLSGTIVPVPFAGRARRGKVFDPADAIATALANRLDSRSMSCLAITGTSRRGSHRARSENPPEIRATHAAPRSVLLVDDVLQGGAVLSASAKALRAVGASRVVAITFARR